MGNAGFSLIEILITLVIFSTVILGLAGLAFRIARSSVRATDQALVMGRLLSLVDVASVVRFDSLPALTRCDSTASGTVTVVGCVVVTSLSPRVSSIRIIVSTTVPGSHPDTIVMQRSRDRAPIPLR